MSYIELLQLASQEAVVVLAPFALFWLCVELHLRVEGAGWHGVEIDE